MAGEISERARVLIAKVLGKQFYITQESAMAPGIADGWPEFIPAPHSANGRLMRVTPQFLDEVAVFAESEAALTRRQERKECAEAICSYCHSSQFLPAEWNHTYHGWFHKDKLAVDESDAERTMSRCYAAQIHERTRSEIELKAARKVS